MSLSHASKSTWTHPLSPTNHWDSTFIAMVNLIEKPPHCRLSSFWINIIKAPLSRLLLQENCTVVVLPQQQKGQTAENSPRMIQGLSLTSSLSWPAKWKTEQDTLVCKSGYWGRRHLVATFMVYPAKRKLGNKGHVVRIIRSALQ